MMNSSQSIRCLVAMTLAIAATEALAQSTTNLFNETFVNVFDPESRTYFSLQGVQGNQFGGQLPYTSFGASHYTGSIDSTVTLYNGQLLVNNNGNPAGTFGAQYRRLTELRLLNTSILGAGVYMDLNQSRYNNLFQQVNVNFELMTESSWVVRANGYLPVGQIQQQAATDSVVGGAPGQLSLIGSQVWSGGINRRLMDVAMMGSDLEFGRKFLDYRGEVYGGYYNWNGPLMGFTNGVKGGVRGYLTNNLSANINISHDQFFGTNVYGGLTLVFGGAGGSRPLSFLSLMTLPVQRAQQVSIANAVRTENTFHPVADSTTGNPLHVYFVEQGGAGTGLRNDPSNIASVLANPTFGNGSAMVLLSNNGNITSPIVLTHDRQQIVGSMGGNANLDFSLAMGQPQGTSVLHLGGLGSQAVLAPTSGNAITLTNQDTIQGFRIDGSSGLANGIVGAPGANGTLVSNMTIQNVAGVGIKIQPSANTTIDHVQFINNGQDVLLDAKNSIITNVTSTGSANGSISLGAGGDITGVSQISNVSITNAGGFGGLLFNNAQAGANVNLNNVSIIGGTGSGITVTNSQAGAGYNMAGVTINNVGGAGVSLQNSAGTLTMNSASSIINPLGVAMLVNGGAINVNDAGSISQSNNASAVAVTGNHTGTINFTNVSTISTTNGTGLQFNGANGTYNFLGTSNISGPNANIFLQSSKGVFTFDNTTINTASAGVKIVGDASHLPQSTFNALNIISNSNPGFFVTNAGTTKVTGGTIGVTAGDGIDVNNTAFTLNNTTVNQTVGFTLNSAASALNGTGNTSATFSGHDGGGNTGSISFNMGANVFP